MFVVGLTGGIGSGKSTVSKYFEHFGIDIIDADILARKLVEPNTDALNSIENHFGAEIILNTGSLNRNALRKIVFDNPQEKSWLESLLHPLIRQESKKRIANSESDYCIYSAALLIENKLFPFVDRILVVDIPEDLQIERATSRDKATPTELNKILRAQISRGERLKHADDVIDNSGTIEETRFQVSRLHQKYLQLAKDTLN